MPTSDTFVQPLLDADDYRQFSEGVSKCAEKQLAEGYLRRAQQDKYFWDIHCGLAREGLLGLGVSTHHEGQGADSISVGLACESISAADFNVSFALLNSVASGHLIENYSTERTRNLWLPEIIGGKKIVAIAVTEPECGSDAAALRTKAEKTSDGWILNGEKTSISLGMHAQGLIVFAKTNTLSESGVSTFLIPKDTPGIERVPLRDSGFRPIGRASIALSDVFVPHECLIGDMGQGFRIAMSLFDYMRALLGLMTIGAAERALRATIEYAKQRHAFGFPIAKFEGVSFPIAEYATKLESARRLCYHALALRDAGLNFSKQAAMAKWWAAHVAVRAIHDCIIIHGHAGYSDDLPLLQLERDVTGVEIGEGPPQIQKMIIARDILGREFLPYI